MKGFRVFSRFLAYWTALGMSLAVGLTLWQLSFENPVVEVRAPFGEAPYELAVLAVLFGIILTGLVMEHKKR